MCGLEYMIKWLPCLYQVKTKKKYSPEPMTQRPLLLVCSIVDVDSTMYG